jgi:hypothetical protein
MRKEGQVEYTREMKYAYKILIRISKGRDHLEDLNTDERTTLK